MIGGIIAVANGLFFIQKYHPTDGSNSQDFSNVSFVILPEKAKL